MPAGRKPGWQRGAQSTEGTAGIQLNPVPTAGYDPQREAKVMILNKRAAAWLGIFAYLCGPW